MKRKSTIFPMLYLLLIVMIAATSPAHAQTAIGGNTPDGSAMLDVQSTSKGVLFPRMTTTERNAIASPATGLMIFNTTTGCLEINLGAGTASWQSIVCTPGLIASIDCTKSRQTGPHLMDGVAASGQSIKVPYTGGNGFDYDGQVLTSTGVTGLTATLTAGSFAVGDDSLTFAITGTGATPGTADFALDIGGTTCTLKVPVGCGAYVAPGDWKVFSCYNLGAVGATSGADPFTPSWELNGDYYQWGTSTKAADGPSDATTPNDSAPASWNTTAAADGSWTDDSSPKGPQDPCPTGFRVPSRTQWDGVVNNNTRSDPPGANWTSGVNNYTSGKLIGTALFLPAAGSRFAADGVLFNRGNYGNYWSSTVSGPSNASYLFLLNVNALISPTSRTVGFAVRCIEE